MKDLPRFAAWWIARLLFFYGFAVWSPACCSTTSHRDQFDFSGVAIFQRQPLALLRACLGFTAIASARIEAPLMKIASSAFNHTLVRLDERILIQSACCICQASELVSRADGSLEEWEEWHSAQHEPADSDGATGLHSGHLAAG